MAVVRREAEGRLARDRAMEAEESLAGNAAGRESLVAPSGLEFDFSEAMFPEMGGGPMTFWAGSFEPSSPAVPPGTEFGFSSDNPVAEQDQRNA